MKIKAVAAFAALMSISTAPVIASVQANRVTEGSAVVLRDGKAVIADAGSQLQAGDRVISRDGAVSYSFGTCSQALDGASMATVGGECGEMVSLSGGDVQDAVRAAAKKKILANFLPAGLALTAVVVGVVIAADDSDNKAGSPS